MNKNWLIRTKSNHILGPISKAKTCELYKNGSIKPDDEICSGNGYWFFVKESKLIQKYLLGDEVQSFNPISEANDSIGVPSVAKPPASAPIVSKKEDFDDVVKMPNEDDLAFPDMGEISKPEVKTEIPSQSAPRPVAHTQEIPPEPKIKSATTNVHIEPPKRRETIKPKKEDEIPEIVKPKISDHKKLYTMAIVILLLAIVALLYRKYSAKSSVKISHYMSPISSAYADIQEIKKKI